MRFLEHYLKEDEEYKIFLDMDGTITDFERAYEAIADIDYSAASEGDIEEFWYPINKAGIEFWSEMPWMEDGKILWDFVKDKNTTILSSPGKGNASPRGKTIWIKRELGDVDFILDGEKHKYVKKNAILIDDTDEKIDKWEEAGGIGILHQSASETIERLKNILKGEDDNG